MSSIILHYQNLSLFIIGVISLFACISYNIENNMFFSARYYYGLSDLWKQANNTDLVIGYKNNCLQLSVGYMFE